MAFCWFTSFIGYPNFFADEGRGYELAQFFRTFANAAHDGMSYQEAKGLFPNLDHAQVETKKAAFQEFGLLYVVPGSDIITLTPLGRHVLQLAGTPEEARGNRRQVLLELTTALARYRFNNPLPVGGNRSRVRAASTDVCPYLATLFLLIRSGGVLSNSEFRGAVFGIQRMTQVTAVAGQLQERRASRQPFPKLPQLPAHTGTAENLRIYFWSHVSLDNQIASLTAADVGYGEQEPVVQLTQTGYELGQGVLDNLWPGWRRGTRPPRFAPMTSVDEYFSRVVGALVTPEALESFSTAVAREARRQTEGVLDFYDVEALKDLPREAFEEGRRRLVTHVKTEKVRNTSLVKAAKTRFKQLHGRLSCEICQFDFQAVYGDRGEDYIEAHHKVPISQLADGAEITVESMGMVCANCHRMLHRQPWLTMEELVALMQ